MTVQTCVPKYSEQRGARRTMNPEYIALWESYLDEGLSAKQVGEIFGVAKTTVLNHYPGRGWTPKQRLDYSMDVKRLNRLRNTL